jgi:hypothetical protein
LAEYLANSVQTIALNQAAVFAASIPCTRGFVFHEDETGIFILRGATPNRFARYQVVFNGNIAVPTGGTVGPIAISLAVNGEPRTTSRAIVTPAAVEEYFNVTSTAIITVPCGCCFSLSVRYVPASDDTTVVPTPNIELQNANLTISRIA